MWFSAGRLKFSLSSSNKQLFHIFSEGSVVLPSPKGFCVILITLLKKLVMNSDPLDIAVSGLFYGELSASQPH